MDTLLLVSPTADTKKDTCETKTFSYLSHQRHPNHGSKSTRRRRSLSHSFDSPECPSDRISRRRTLAPIAKIVKTVNSGWRNAPTVTGRVASGPSNLATMYVECSAYIRHTSICSHCAKDAVEKAPLSNWTCVCLALTER